MEFGGPEKTGPAIACKADEGPDIVAAFFFGRGNQPYTYRSGFSRSGASTSYPILCFRNPSGVKPLEKRMAVSRGRATPFG